MLILVGPPGFGMTTIAKKLKQSIAEELRRDNGSASIRSGTAHWMASNLGCRVR